MARILVVENDRESLALMLLLLQAFGHEPMAASSGAKAIDLAAVMPPEVILLDIEMPKMDGFETARILKTNSALDGVPLVALTSLAAPGDRERILEAGFAGYISKPIDAGRLPGQLAAFFGPAIP